MKKVLIIALSLFTLVCGAQTIVASGSIGENLDLQALGELVRRCQNAEDIENRLNSDNSINNLDLDNDGNVDYIRVTEYGTGYIRGFSFVASLNGDNQEVATIEIKNNNNNATVSIYGNEGIYGANCNFTYNYPIAQLILFNYLFRPHVIYVSPYRYGYYPTRYRVYRRIPIATYRSTIVTRHRGSYVYTRGYSSRPHYTSPNRNYNSRYVRNNSYNNRGNNNYNRGNNNYNNRSYNNRSYSPATNNRINNVANPTGSQKSFNRTSPANSRPKTDGFKSRPTSTYSRPTSTGSSYSRPVSTNRSSGFGSSNRSSGSSGSSYRSSGSSSRSGGFGSSSRSSSSGGRRH